MKTFSTIALLSAAALSSANPLLERNACNADNCARAVTGTNPINPPYSSRIADCSSFFRVTVTPATKTNTATTTMVITSFKTVPTTVATTFIGDTSAPPNKRDADAGPVTNSPTAVPTYASACSGTARYSSACSCGGVTHVTTTVATPTTTVTKTVTKNTVVTVNKPVTETVLPGPRPTCGGTVRGHGECGCNYVVTCGQEVMGSDPVVTRDDLTEQQCINTCDEYANCNMADYSRSTGICRVYAGSYGSTMKSASDDTITWNMKQCPGSPPQGCGYLPSR